LPIRFDPRHFLLALTVLAVWLAWLVVRPFARVLFMAAVVATVIAPLASALAGRMKGARGRAAALITLGLLLALVGPLAAIATVVVGQATEAVNWLGRAVHEGGLAGLIERLPQLARPLASELADRVRDACAGRPVDITLHLSPDAALRAAAAAADPADRIVVFGSFFTVGGVLKDGLPRLAARHLTQDRG